MPRRVSALLRMPQAGYGPETCLAFDEYCLMRVLRFERMQAETVEVDAPKPRKHARPKMRVSAHDEAALLNELDVDPEDRETSEMVAASIAAVDWESDWDALGGDEGDEVGDGDD